jgi:hypothetical protein
MDPDPGGQLITDPPDPDYSNFSTEHQVAQGTGIFKQEEEKTFENPC